MALTTAQQATLKAAIEADATLNAFPSTLDGAFAIAALLNLPASPDFWVWRTNVPTADCKKAMVWTEFIARSVGERDAWQFMLSNGIINAADINVRQGIQDIFSGPGGAAVTPWSAAARCPGRSSASPGAPDAPPPRRRCAAGPASRR